MRGQAGNDIYVVDNIGDHVIELSGAGIDTILSSISTSLNFGGRLSVENLTLTGAAFSGTGNGLGNRIFGNNSNNSLNGLAGSDSLFGRGGNDLLLGGIGNDSLNGGAGADNIRGQAGNDLINGGFGNDHLRGQSGHDTITTGAGSDTIRFDTLLGTGNIDTVEDYNTSSDSFELDDAIFAALLLGPLAAAAFQIGATAADADDRIIYNDTTGQLFYDPDGNVAASTQTQFALLSNTPIVSATDFFVV